jgi:peptidoglycan/xylan/chitin deacetylase (PgdA/CDA1 family)
MRVKYLLIFGCMMVAAAIGVSLALSKPAESQVEDPTITVGVTQTQRQPEVTATAGQKLPGVTPSMTLTLTQALPTVTLTLPNKQSTIAPISTYTSLPGSKRVTLPVQLIQSAGTMVEDFENVKDWVKVAGQAPTADNTNFKTGSASLHVTGDSSPTIVQKTVNWDLSKLPAIRFWANHFVTGNDTYEIDLATRADFSAYFSAQVTTYGKNWNLKQVGRDEFVSNDGAVWTDRIVGIRFKVNAGQDYDFDTLSINVSTVPVVMIDFDDGDASVYSVALPVLKSHHMTATAYVPTHFIGTPGYMTVAQLQDLQANGWTIGNHTFNHVLLKGLPAADQEKELSTAQQTLVGWGLTGGNYVAYPDGKYDTNTLSILTSLGMLSGRTTSNAPDVFPDLNLYVMRTTQDVSGQSLAQIKAMVAENKKRGGVLTLLFHTLSPGYAQTDTEWNGGMFNSLLDYIAASGETTLTIDQFVRLKTEGVKVNAPAGQ